MTEEEPNDNRVEEKLHAVEDEVARRFNADQQKYAPLMETILRPYEEDARKKWPDDVIAIARFHRLNQTMHGRAVKGFAGKGWGLVETAKALGIRSAVTVHVALKIADAIAINPELADCQSKKDALDAMKHSSPSKHNLELAAIRDFIRDTGGHSYPLTPCGKNRTRGLPDLYCQMPASMGNASARSVERFVAPSPGLRFWVEVKVGQDVLHQDQIEFREREIVSGGIEVVGGLNGVKRLLASNGFVLSEK